MARQGAALECDSVTPVSARATVAFQMSVNLPAPWFRDISLEPGWLQEGRRDVGGINKVPGSDGYRARGRGSHSSPWPQKEINENMNNEQDVSLRFVFRYLPNKSQFV